MSALIMALLLVLSGLALSGMAAQKAEPNGTKNAPGKTTKGAGELDGEKLFRAHCGRCHAAPEELSPRVARTAIHHMRVRAMLSKEDEQAILSYIAPD